MDHGFARYAGDVIRRAAVPAERGETVTTVISTAVSVLSGFVTQSWAIGTFAFVVWLLILLCWITPYRMWRDNGKRINELETPRLAFDAFGKELRTGDRGRHLHFWVEIKNVSGDTVWNPRIMCSVLDIHATPIASSVPMPLRRYAENGFETGLVPHGLDAQESLRFWTVELVTGDPMAERYAGVLGDYVRIDFDKGRVDDPMADDWEHERVARPTFPAQSFFLRLTAYANGMLPVSETLYLENCMGANPSFERCGDVDPVTHTPKSMYVPGPNARVEKGAADAA